MTLADMPKGDRTCDNCQMQRRCSGYSEHDAACTDCWKESAESVRERANNLISDLEDEIFDFNAACDGWCGNLVERLKIERDEARAKLAELAEGGEA